MPESLPPLLQHVASLGHLVFSTGAWNLNIVGERSPNRTADSFDDRISVVCKDDSGAWVQKSWAATTDPGLYWLHNPSRVAGTGILVPGQYRGAYELGKHKGVDDALVQVRPVKVYRDANLDDVLDMDPAKVEEGLFGINLHHAGSDSSKVDKWSAACQVWKRRADHDEFLALCRKQKTKGAGWDRFTYTLVPMMAA